MPGFLHIKQHLHLVGQWYKAGRVFTLRANCLAALKLFGKIIISLRYSSGDIFTNCIATFSIVAHLSTALQNKSHKSFMSAAVPKVLVTNRNRGSFWFKSYGQSWQATTYRFMVQNHCYHLPLCPQLVVAEKCWRQVCNGIASQPRERRRGGGGGQRITLGRLMLRKLERSTGLVGDQGGTQTLVFTF